LLRRLRAFRFGDRGAVAVEFALIAPVMLLLCTGIFGVGYVMIQDLQLNFVVEYAAKYEAAGNDAAAKAYASPTD
jgi:Flp pilus assembly protein TadG